MHNKHMMVKARVSKPKGSLLGQAGVEEEVEDEAGEAMQAAEGAGVEEEEEEGVSRNVAVKMQGILLTDVKIASSPKCTACQEVQSIDGCTANGALLH